MKIKLSELKGVLNEEMVPHINDIDSISVNVYEVNTFDLHKSHIKHNQKYANMKVEDYDRELCDIGFNQPHSPLVVDKNFSKSKYPNGLVLSGLKILRAMNDLNEEFTYCVDADELDALLEDQYKYPGRKHVRDQTAYPSSFDKSKTFGGRGGEGEDMNRKDSIASYKKQMGISNKSKPIEERMADRLGELDEAISENFLVKNQDTLGVVNHIPNSSSSDSDNDIEVNIDAKRKLDGRIMEEWNSLGIDIFIGMTEDKAMGILESIKKQFKDSQNS